MPIRRSLVPALALALLDVGTATRAHAQAFTGSVDVTLPTFVPVSDLARCGASPPNVRMDWQSFPGTSNFGAFTYASSNCLDRSTGSFFNGLFTLSFGGIVLAALHIAAGWVWAVFHILIIVLQAFVFMMLTLVYVGQAHDSH